MDIAAKLFRDAKSNERLTLELVVWHEIYLLNVQNTTSLLQVRMSVNASSLVPVTPYRTVLKYKERLSQSQFLNISS